VLFGHPYNWRSDKLLGAILNKDIEYVQVRVEDWDKLWAAFGMEVALQMKVLETAGLEKGCSKPGVVALKRGFED
jgi:hypothetical protein